MDYYKILLASKSPRRRQLIGELGFEFEIVTQDIEETFPEDMPKHKVPEYLAKQKATAVREHLRDGCVILASDTIVLMDDEIFHKPKDYEDAVRILSRLSGGMHQVITGVCLMSQDNEVVFSGVSDVYIEPLSREEMDFYIQNYKPFDKAGAYAIQEWIGLAKIQRIEGSYANIVGLPTALVYENMQKYFKL